MGEVRTSILNYGAKNLHQVFLQYKERYQHQNVLRILRISYLSELSIIPAALEGAASIFLCLICPAVLLATLSQAAALRELLQSG